MSFLRSNLFQWRTAALLGLALLARLSLSPYPGFVSDVDGMVQYARVTTQKSLFAVSEIPTTELWPAGFVYHADLVGHILKNELRGSGHIFAETSIVERMGIRAFPIAYDLAIGAVLLLALTLLVSRPAGEWGAAIYLFNPGTILNSALWNYDAMASFYLLVAVLLLGRALGDNRRLFWALAWGTAGMAFCLKLQAGMLLPALGLMTLLTRRLSLMLWSAITFLAVVIAIYAPFLAGQQWFYLKRVFIDSFQSYPVTDMNACNLWGLWPPMPVNYRVAGITLETVGRALYLGVLAWLAWLVWKRKVAHSAGVDAFRRTTIVSAYACLAPFILLTRMHERYLAPAVALCVMAGLLDRRLRAFMWGISAVYAINLLLVMIQSYWLPLMSETALQIINVGFGAGQFFCSLLNVGLFVWLSRRLPTLLCAPEPAV